MSLHLQRVLPRKTKPFHKILARNQCASVFSSYKWMGIRAMAYFTYSIQTNQRKIYTAFYDGSSGLKRRLNFRKVGFIYSVQTKVVSTQTSNIPEYFFDFRWSVINLDIQMESTINLFYHQKRAKYRKFTRHTHTHTHIVLAWIGLYWSNLD